MFSGMLKKHNYLVIHVHNYILFKKYVNHGSTFSAPFNNTQTLKFKTYLIIGFLVAINHNNYDYITFYYDNSKNRNKQNGLEFFFLLRHIYPWPFEPVEVHFCFLRGPPRWLTAAEHETGNTPYNVPHNWQLGPLENLLYNNIIRWDDCL